jgi:hypothetical protein
MSGGGASDIDGLSDGHYNSTSKSVGLGALALANENVAAPRYNTAVGHEALTTNVSGLYNTSVGYQSGMMTTAAHNTSSGAWSLKTNSSGANNCAYGSYTLFLNLTGSNNTALGQNSLKNNIGSKNIGVGQDAGSAITTGANNTIIGSLTGTTTLASTVLIGAGTIERLKVDSSGLSINGGTAFSSSGASDINGLSDGVVQNYCLGLGTNALANQSASLAFNVAVGEGAQRYVTGGKFNTAVGFESMLGYTLGATGNGNVGIGNASLYSLSSGDNNIAIGSSVLDATTTASGSTAVGGGALGAADADENVGVGYLALRDTTTGAYNTAVGSWSAVLNQTGTENVCVGQYSAPSRTVGSKNVNIGANTSYAAASGNNNITIGHVSGSALVSGENNTIIGSLPGTSGTMSDTVLIGAGTTERVKVDSTGLYINGSGTPVGSGGGSVGITTGKAIAMAMIFG